MHLLIILYNFQPQKYVDKLKLIFENLHYHKFLYVKKYTFLENYQVGVTQNNINILHTLICKVETQRIASYLKFTS